LLRSSNTAANRLLNPYIFISNRLVGSLTFSKTNKSSRVFVSQSGKQQSEHFHISTFILISRHQSTSLGTMHRISLLLLLLISGMTTLVGQSIPNSSSLPEAKPISRIRSAGHFRQHTVMVEETGLSHVYTHRLYKVLTASGPKR
jgi:hypothetical protein